VRDQDHAGQERGGCGDGHHGPGWEPGGEGSGAGGGDGLQVIKTYYLDLDATEKVVARARAQRVKDGTLTGYALGEADESEARNVLADVLSVFAANERGLWWSVLADRLAETYPDGYAGTTADAISDQCRNLGVKSRPVRMPGAEPQRGCNRADVEAAQAAS
jgi:DNA segregation ATPase FtsK/SpoIIIE, S-DNA-T family